MQTLKLSDDLAMKLGMVEAYDNELHRADGHGNASLNGVFAGLPENVETRRTRRSKYRSSLLHRRR